MNKVNIIMTFVIIGILLYIGGLVYYEMAIELEEHPEIKDIGGPPVITDLRLLVIVVGVTCLFCGIVLKMHPKEDVEEVDRYERLE